MACSRRDRLQVRAPLADPDALVAFPGDEDGRVYAPQPAFQLELVDLDRGSIRQLVAQQVEEFFTQELGGKHALAYSGELLGVEEARALGQELGNGGDERFDLRPAR